jgi:hypothetical protein
MSERAAASNICLMTSMKRQTPTISAFVIFGLWSSWQSIRITADMKERPIDRSTSFGGLRLSFHLEEDKNRTDQTMQEKND